MKLSLSTFEDLKWDKFVNLYSGLGCPSKGPTVPKNINQRGTTYSLLLMQRVFNPLQVALNRG